MKWATLACAVYGVAVMSWEPEAVELAIWATLTLVIALLEFGAVVYASRTQRRTAIDVAEIEAGATVLAARMSASQEDDDE